MNMELMEALNILEKEKDISKDALLGAIEQSLLLACKNPPLHRRQRRRSRRSRKLLFQKK